MSMYGLTERELAGSLDHARPSFVQSLAAGGIGDLRMPASPPALHEYIQAAQRGGFPDVAYRLTADRARRLWLASYIDDLVTRDAATFGHGKDPGKLRNYLEALALNNAGIPTEASLYEAAGINARTAAGYDRLLANLYVLDLVPAWPLTANRLKALVKAPKRYLVDTGMAAAAACPRTTSSPTRGCWAASSMLTPQPNCGPRLR